MSSLLIIHILSAGIVFLTSMVGIFAIIKNQQVLIKHSLYGVGLMTVAAVASGSILAVTSDMSIRMYCSNVLTYLLFSLVSMAILSYKTNYSHRSAVYITQGASLSMFVLTLLVF